MRCLPELQSCVAMESYYKSDTVVMWRVEAMQITRTIVMWSHVSETAGRQQSKFIIIILHRIVEYRCSSSIHPTILEIFRRDNISTRATSSPPARPLSAAGNTLMAADAVDFSLPRRKLTHRSAPST